MTAARLPIRLAGRRTLAELHAAVADGGRLVRYPYVVSPVIASLRIESPVYFARNGEAAVYLALPYLLANLLLGPWGLPWGPLLTLRAVRDCLDGGVDVTDDVLAELASTHPA